LLVRFARRLANWEGALTAEELQKREFKARDGGPDLRASVYALNDEPAHLERAYAEHMASLDMKTGLGVDLATPARPFLVNAGNPAFAFIRDRHREIPFRDGEELLIFLQAVIDSLAPRKREVAKQAASTYVRERLAEGDGEWCRVAEAPGAKSWVVALKVAAATERGDFFYQCDLCKTPIPASFDVASPENVHFIVENVRGGTETTFRCDKCWR
jgi:hypothetical protein